MKEVHFERSGIWGQNEPAESPRVEPETLILVIAWLLAVAQIVIGVVRGEAFGPDRAFAVAFAVGCPLLLLRRR